MATKPCVDCGKPVVDQLMAKCPHCGSVAPHGFAHYLLGCLGTFIFVVVLIFGTIELWLKF